MTESITEDRRQSERRDPLAALCGALGGFRVRFTDILARCSTEMTELLIALSMIQSAIILIFFATVPPLPFPSFFGHALGVSGTIGLAGLASRAMWVRLVFAISGVVLRSWMAFIFLIRDSHDPSWVSLAMAAVGLIWVALRLPAEKMKGNNE